MRFTEDVRDRAEALLKEGLGPEQIAGAVKKEGGATISHEAIYRHVRKDKKEGGKLHAHLRHGGKKYRKRGAAKGSRGTTPNRTGIEKRPEAVEKRERFGNLEVDFIVGKDGKGAIPTMNDRASGMLKMRKLGSKRVEEVADAMVAEPGNGSPTFGR